MWLYSFHKDREEKASTEEPMDDSFSLVEPLSSSSTISEESSSINELPPTKRKLFPDIIIPDIIVPDTQEKIPSTPVKFEVKDSQQPDHSIDLDEISIDIDLNLKIE
jgi:hypothetical protein